MVSASRPTLEAQWAQLGVLLAVAPAHHEIDLERVLLHTAREVSAHARLFGLTITWLAEYSGFIAKHRLRRLVIDELEPAFQPALGLILEEAITHGAQPDLRLAIEVCRPARPPRPLFAASQDHASLRTLAEQTASAASKRWGVWAPAADLKKDAIRPAAWLLEQNPSLRGRIVRRGDLRCSILETLRHDTHGEVESESALARLNAATRVAVRKSLQALVLEGEIRYIDRDGRGRGVAIVHERRSGQDGPAGSRSHW